MKNSTAQQAQDSAQPNAELPIIVSRKEAIARNLNKYFTGNKCSRGHVSERYTISCVCIDCSLFHGKGDKRKKFKRDYRIKNRDKILKQDRERNRTNKDKLNKRTRDWHKNNRDKVNLARKERYKNNHNIRISIAMRGMVKRILNLSGKEKTMPSFDYLGYSKDQLTSHLEVLFCDGMSWENYGDWHIDHIKPVSVMLNEGITDPKTINALSNLQPLWAFDNHSKGSKYYE